MNASDRRERLENELHRFLPLLINRYQPDKVILFGSLATGAVHEWSDLDLAVIKQTNKRFLDRISEVTALIAPRLGCDVVVYTPEEFRQMIAERNDFVVDEIQRGKTLYERPQ